MSKLSRINPIAWFERVATAAGARGALMELYEKNPREFLDLARVKDRELYPTSSRKDNRIYWQEYAKLRQELGYDADQAEQSGN